MKLDFRNIGKGLESIATAKREKEYSRAVDEAKKRREEERKITETQREVSPGSYFDYEGVQATPAAGADLSQYFYQPGQMETKYQTGTGGLYSTRAEAEAALPAANKYQQYYDRADLAEEYGFYDRAKELRNTGLELEKQQQLSSYYGTQEKLAQAKLSEQERAVSKAQKYDADVAAAMQIRDPLEMMNALYQAEVGYNGVKAGTDLFNTLQQGYEKGLLPSDWQRKLFEAKNNKLAVEEAFQSGDFQGMLAPFDLAAGEGVDFKIFQDENGKFKVGKFELDPTTGMISESPAQVLNEFGTHSTIAGLAKRLQDQFGGITDVYNAQIAANKLVEDSMENYVKIAGDLRTAAKNAFDQGNELEAQRLNGQADSYQRIIDAHYIKAGGLSQPKQDVVGALDNLRPKVGGQPNVEANADMTPPVPEEPSPVETGPTSARGAQLPVDYITDYLKSVATQDGKLDLQSELGESIQRGKSKIETPAPRVKGTGEGFNYVPKNDAEVNAWLDEYAPEWYDRGFRSPAQNEAFVESMQKDYYRQKGVPGLRSGGLVRGYKMGGQIPRFFLGGNTGAKAQEAFSYVNDPAERAKLVKNAKANAEKVNTTNRKERMEKIKAIGEAGELIGSGTTSGGGIGDDAGISTDFSDAMAMLNSRRIQSPDYSQVQVNPQAYLQYMQMRRGGGLIHDYRRGGHTANKGTETSDSILARVSKGEYVVNAESMKIPGVPELLESINKMGLQKRAAKRKPRTKKKTTATRKA